MLCNRFVRKFLSFNTSSRSCSRMRVKLSNAGLLSTINAYSSSCTSAWFPDICKSSDLYYYISFFSSHKPEIKWKSLFRSNRELALSRWFIARSLLESLQWMMVASVWEKLACNQIYSMTQAFVHLKYFYP